MEPVLEVDGGGIVSRIIFKQHRTRRHVEETSAVATARPWTFDESEALDAAIGCFWRRGYRATSMRDLEEEMGIGSASHYNVFCDKRTLFLRAVPTENLIRYDAGSRIGLSRA